MKYYKEFASVISKRKIITGISALALITAASLVSVIAFAANDLLQQSVSGPFAPHPITDTIKDLPAKDRATLKGQAIAQIGSIPKERRGDYFIEIQTMQPIDGGIQIFVRAWDADNEQLGFGTDGTVEIERFRFFNSPILVEDAGGDIVRNWTDALTGESRTIRYREDLKEATLQSLEYTIAVKKEKFGSERIITGKVGNTTDTFYPSSEGSMYSAPNATWAGARDATTGTLRDTVVQVNYDGNYLVERAFFNFDTSALPDTDTISSATLSFKGAGANFGSPTANVYSSTASDTIVADDLDLAGSTEYSDTRITSWSTSVFNDFALNTAGLVAISKTGLTKTALRVANYDGDNVAPATLHKFHYVGVDEVGTTNDPKLVVEHSSRAPTNLLVNDLTNPSNIATTSPYFSAIHENASTTAIATFYQIQIATSSSYWGVPHWDSSQLALSSSTPVGIRTPSIFSTTTFAIDGTTYYWRVRLGVQSNALGDWSTTTASFTMTTPPAFVASGYGQGTGNFTVAATSTGSNRLLVCGLSIESNNGPNTVTANWNGTGATSSPESLSLGWVAGKRVNVYYFYWLNPALGTGNVAFTVTGPGITDYAVCASYTGVTQTGQPGTTAMHTETGVRSISTTNLTTYPGSALVGFAFFNGGNASAPTAGSGTTFRDFTDTANWYGVLADNGTTVLSAGNPSLNINRPASGNMATIQASWAPVHN